MRSSALILVLALVLVPVFATGCEPSGGELGLFRPDMTWGPASNNLYGPGVDWVEVFCGHVHVTCQEAPESYLNCLAGWQHSQQYCPFEVQALLSCMDVLYECGDYENWEWWDMMTMACSSEVFEYELCMNTNQQWESRGRRGGRG